MQRRSTEDLQVALVLVRALNGWNKQDLAKAAGLDKSQVTQYELGLRRPTERSLNRILSAAGISPQVFRAILAFIGRLRFSSDSATPAGLERSTDLQEVAVALDAATARILERVQGEYPGLQEAALVERLCSASERAAANDPNHALELASLALRVSETLETAEGSRLQGYAWAHVGNARRVIGNLAGAEVSFLNAKKCLDAGAGAEISLAEDRILDLEASLRRDQGRFSEALGLLEEALTLAQTDSARGRVLVKRATTLEVMWQHEDAREALESALPLIDPNTEPKAFFGLQFNRAVNLLHLLRIPEAAELVTEVHRMAAWLGEELYLVRVRWLEARVAVAQGRLTDAIAALFWVRDQFLHRNYAYDTALASLELAVLYLEEGKIGEVKALAEEMEPVFLSQGVHREALAALRIFTEAATREAVTLDLARRLMTYLERARYDPELRFHK